MAEFCTPPTTVVPPPGTSLEETCAALALAALGCQQSVAGYASTTADFHRVVSYDPPAGTEVEAGTAVVVGYLEQPPSVAVPEVRNVDPNEACRRLQQVFLQCAPVADWPTPVLNVVQHQDVAPGTPVAAGTRVPYYYETVGALPLNRYKAVGEEARFLGLGGPPAGSWGPQPPIGGAYAPGEAGVPGLAVVYQFHCQPTCLQDRSAGYYYSRDPAPPTGCWQLDGPAFSCFPEPGRGDASAPGHVQRCPPGLGVRSASER